MSGHRPRARLLPLAAASAAASALYALWIRPRLLTWGTTREETVRAYPGDELVPDAGSSSTMATTLPAPPGKVWAWLVQMGGDRGGTAGTGWTTTGNRVRTASCPSGRTWRRDSG